MLYLPFAFTEIHRSHRSRHIEVTQVGFAWQRYKQRATETLGADGEGTPLLKSKFWGNMNMGEASRASRDKISWNPESYQSLSRTWMALLPCWEK